MPQRCWLPGFSGARFLGTALLLRSPEASAPPPRSETDAAPATLFQEAFEILSRCSQECLTVDPPEPTQAEASHAMPILPFRKQGFDPDLALAQRLFVALQV